MTLEPCESYGKEDLDEYAAVLKHIRDEAYSDPEVVKMRLISAHPTSWPMSLRWMIPSVGLPHGERT